VSSGSSGPHHQRHIDDRQTAGSFTLTEQGSTALEALMMPRSSDEPRVDRAPAARSAFTPIYR
jgi:hypothetical protein